MYLDFYNLREKPFNLMASAKFLYLGEVHKEALALLTYGVNERKGFVLLTGEVGTGKTTMARAFLRRLGDKVRHVFVSNPSLSPTELLSYLALTALGKKEPFRTKAEFLVDFEAFLKRCLHHRQRFVLIIDEAQKLSFELLEEVRLLSNMETGEERLIQVFLIGQPELVQKLMDPRCKSLLQRIDSRFHIAPLDLKGTLEYLTTRLKAAGARNGEEVFTEDAMGAVYAYSGGYPRAVNTLADNAMLLGYSRGEKRITPEMVRECFEDMALPGAASRVGESPASSTRREETRQEADIWASLG